MAVDGPPRRRHVGLAGAAVVAVVALASVVVLATHKSPANTKKPVTTPPVTAPPSGVAGPVTPLHYAADGNFDAAGHFALSSLGFNLADVSSRAQVDSLPAGVKGLAFLGLCGGADATFIRAVNAYQGDPRIFGFYLIDEPDPTGKYRPLCLASNLKAESDWIHEHVSGVKTMVVLMSLASSKAPSFQDSYNPANSGIDLYGIDPYPCRTELKECDYSMIGRYVSAAEVSGVPRSGIVPVYETFGGGDYPDDGGGFYRLPTAGEAARILALWSKLTPTPAFDYAYSWGSQNGDTALSGAPAALQKVFAQHNGTS